LKDQADKTAIQNRLIELIKEVMENDSIDIDPMKSLIDDYGIDSLDLLDFSFNIEEIYNVKIGKDELAGRAKHNLSKDEMIDENGCISERALEELQRCIPEIPSDKIVRGLKQSDIPRLLNIAVFTRIVYNKLTGCES
jgi:acyl carrier protein